MRESLFVRLAFVLVAVEAVLPAVVLPAVEQVALQAVGQPVAVAGTLRILRAQILPNAYYYLIVSATLSFPGYILAEGPQSQTPPWTKG